MQTIPFTSHREIFERLANVGNVAALSREDRLQYEYDLKKARDYNAEMRYAIRKGRVEGRAEGIAEGRDEARYVIASKMLESGFDPEKISSITDIPLAELQEHFCHP